MSQLSDKLQTLDIDYSAYYLGLKNDGNNEHFLWSCHVVYNGKTITNKIKLGIAHVKIPYFVKSSFDKREQHRHPKSQPIPPPLEDFIYCLCVDSSCANETFENWCDSYGYDTDSRKALELYLTCQKTLSEMQRVFGYELTTELISLEH